VLPRLQPGLMGGLLTEIKKPADLIAQLRAIRGRPTSVG
jgi:hypothetical protein